MLFCEKCNVATAEKFCPSCGSKKLRAADNDDFCYLLSTSAFNFEMFESALKENDADVVGVPYYPYGVTRANAGRAGGRKVYVRYKDMERAKEIYETIFGRDE